MKHYYIYKITNKINGKIYIGKRTTKNNPQNDPYMGSGKVIKLAIEKYGLLNFEKEILELCTKETLSEREIFYIEKYSCRDNTIGYNILAGGEGVGDFCHERKTYYNRDTDQEIRIEETQIPPKGFVHGRRKFSNEATQKMARFGKSNGMYNVHRYGENNPFYGKRHTSEAKKKISEKNKGNRWIYNPITLEQRVIRVNDEIPEDFLLGRPKRKKEKRSDKELHEIWSKQRKEFWKNKKKEICPHCGKEGRGAGFYRWHMDNCRNHPINGELNAKKQKKLQNNLSKKFTNRTGTTKGKICINNGVHNKFINKEDIGKYPEYTIGMIKTKYLAY